MPKCLNDSDRIYKGNEPSPKGLGYCEYVESVGTKKRGKDGNMWVIIFKKNGVKKWNKSKNNDYIQIILNTPTDLEMKKILSIIKEEEYKLILVRQEYDNYVTMCSEDTSMLKKILELFYNISIKYPNFRYLVELKIENIKYRYRVHTNKKGKVIVTKAATKLISIWQYRLP